MAPRGGERATTTAAAATAVAAATAARSGRASDAMQGLRRSRSSGALILSPKLSLLDVPDSYLPLSAGAAEAGAAETGAGVAEEVGAGAEEVGAEEQDALVLKIAPALRKLKHPSQQQQHHHQHHPQPRHYPLPYGCDSPREPLITPSELDDATEDVEAKAGVVPSGGASGRGSRADKSHDSTAAAVAHLPFASKLWLIVSRPECLLFFWTTTVMGFGLGMIDSECDQGRQQRQGSILRAGSRVVPG